MLANKDLTTHPKESYLTGGIYIRNKFALAILAVILGAGVFGYAQELATAGDEIRVAGLQDFCYEIFREAGDSGEVLPLYGRTVILDAGHGLGNSPAFAGYVEAVTMLELAFKIAPLLEAQGAEVFLTRADRYDIHLSVRAAHINLMTLYVLAEAGYDCAEEIERLKGTMRRVIYNFPEYAPVYFNFPFDHSRNTLIHPDLLQIFELQASPSIQENFLFVSLHSNAVFPIDTSVHGAYIYFMQNDYYKSETYFNNYASPELSYLFGNLLIENIHDLGIKRREVRPGNWFVIREHNLPGVLAENGFHTNAYDRALLSCDEWLGRLAYAYLDAIVRYFYKALNQLTNPSGLR